MRPILTVLALSTLLACSKKQPPTASESPVPGTSASTTAVTKAEPSVAPSTSASAPAVDDAIEGEFTPVESLAFPEGKILPIPKFKQADKEAAKAHAGALQTEFEAIVKEGFKEQNRFNASFIPATYILMMHPGKPGKTPEDATPDEWTLLVAEGTNVVRQPVAFVGGPKGDMGSTNAWALMQTSRGWLVDTLGDGSLLYILRRSGRPLNAEPLPMTWDCVGKQWSPESGAVAGGTVPDYPGRGKDIDGDGKNEFPTRRFAFELPLFRMTGNPSSSEVCNLLTDLPLTIGVLGATSIVESWSEKSEAMAGFYERRQKAAKKRAEKIRAWAGDGSKPVTRKTTELRMTNECALDVAQTASELYVYARTLGESEADAIAQADGLMKGFALKPLSCSGVERRSPTADAATDFWPELRKALLAAKIGEVAAAKPAPSASAPSAAPSPSGSK